MLTELMTRVFPSWGAKAEARTTDQRRTSVDVAVAWWVETLRGRDGVTDEGLAAFGPALRDDLVSRLGDTYRVYLEVNFQPKGVLRTAAMAAGLDLDAFPHGAMMAVSDGKVEVSKAALEPYVSLLPA